MNVVSIRKNEAGAWCVRLNGAFISDHRTHDGARTAAQNIVNAERAAGTATGSEQ